MKHEQPKDPEFWTILKTPPKKSWTTEDELYAIMSEELCKEIDRELLETLIGLSKK